MTDWDEKAQELWDRWHKGTPGRREPVIPRIAAALRAAEAEGRKGSEAEAAAADFRITFLLAERDEARAEVARLKEELAEAQNAAGKDADNIASHARADALKEAEAIARTEAIRWSEESHARFAANRAADSIAALTTVRSGDPVALADEIAISPSDGAIYAAESRASDPAGYDAIVTQSVEAVKDESNREIERGVFALLEIAQERIEWLERENNTLAGMKKERDEARQWLESRFAYLPWMTSIDSARAAALKEAEAKVKHFTRIEGDAETGFRLVRASDVIAALAEEPAQVRPSEVPTDGSTPLPGAGGEEDRAIVPEEYEQAMKAALEGLLDAKRSHAAPDPRDAEIAKLTEVAKMVDAWGHGMRHSTEHESKMVKAARAALRDGR